MSKPKTIKEKVDPFSINNSKTMVESEKLNPGPRPDNAWCHYDKNNIPKNEEQWNEVRYSFNCYLGYYSWPKYEAFFFFTIANVGGYFIAIFRFDIREVLLHSSSSIQPVNNIRTNELSNICREIDLFFSDTSNIERLLEYLCLEEKKGESLYCYNISLFKVGVVVIKFYIGINSFFMPY